MKYLSLFSGIEACTVAWKPLGWKCVGFSEIEPFPCSLLAHHYPTVPNLGDITQITEQQIAELGDFDVLVFGSPCQDLSAAGTRKGFQDGTRSNLFYEALRIFDYARKHNNCRFALWENVPGAFSSNKGADFAAVVREMAGLQGVPIPPTSGETRALRWARMDCLNGEYLTLNTSDWHKDASVCLLSSILETGTIDPRYYLSKKACEGILTRAKRRGVVLPSLLQMALEQRVMD